MPELAGVSLRVDAEARVRDLGIERPRLLDHAFREIDSDGLAEAAGERPRDATDPAAEVERAHAARRPAQLAGPRERTLGVRLSCRKEGVELPAAPATGRVGQDRPERIDGRQVLPLPLLSSYHVRAGLLRYTRPEPGTRSS